jgi:hypothetical protein
MPTPSFVMKTDDRTDLTESPLRQEWRGILTAARANPLPPVQLYDSSPAHPVTNEHDGHLLIRQFESSDVIWLGSSKRLGTGRLVEARELLRLKPGRDAFVISNAFQSKRIQVGRSTPVTRRFLTLAVPRLPLSVQGSLLYRLREHLPLVAIVAATPCRLEGWYRWKAEWDEPAVKEAIQERLAGLGFSEKRLNPLRVWHLPGVVNSQTNFTQSLLYLDPIHE